VHNQITGSPQLQRAIRALLNETSQDFEGIIRLGESLTPVLQLWDTGISPEWALLRNEYLMGGFNSSAAVAGQLAFCAISSRVANSGIIVLESVRVQSSTAQDIRWGTIQAQSGSQVPTNLGARDTRNTPIPVSGRIAGLFSGNNAASLLGVTTTLGTATLAANVGLDLVGPWVIVGNAMFLIELQTVNTTFSHATWKWRERMAGAGEQRGQL
jgi:hypothetical protein